MFRVLQPMATANGLPAASRLPALASPLHELTGFYLAADCLTPDCRVNGLRRGRACPNSTGGSALSATSCAACGTRAAARACRGSMVDNWPDPQRTGPPRRVLPLGPQARE